MLNAQCSMKYSQDGSSAVNSLIEHWSLVIFPSPHLHRPLWHRNGLAPGRLRFLHERRHHWRRTVIGPERALLVEELLPPLLVVLKQFVEFGPRGNCDHAFV